MCCRQTSLRRIARWVTQLVGHVDLTPSDIVLALILTATLQRKRRRHVSVFEHTWSSTSAPVPVLRGCIMQMSISAQAAHHCLQHVCKANNDIKHIPKLCLNPSLCLTSTCSDQHLKPHLYLGFGSSVQFHAESTSSVACARVRRSAAGRQPLRGGP